MALHNKICLVVAIFCVSVLVLMQPANAQRCPRNQRYVTCGSPCPPRCGDSPLMACTRECFIGCQCRRGLVLNRSGQCVPRNRC